MLLSARLDRTTFPEARLPQIKRPLQPTFLPAFGEGSRPPSNFTVSALAKQWSHFPAFGVGCTLPSNFQPSTLVKDWFHLPAFGDGPTQASDVTASALGKDWFHFPAFGNGSTPPSNFQVVAPIKEWFHLPPMSGPNPATAVTQPSLESSPYKLFIGNASGRSAYAKELSCIPASKAVVTSSTKLIPAARGRKTTSIARATKPSRVLKTSRARIGPRSTAILTARLDTRDVFSEVRSDMKVVERRISHDFMLAANGHGLVDGGSDEARDTVWHGLI